MFPIKKFVTKSVQNPEFVLQLACRAFQVLRLIAVSIYLFMAPRDVQPITKGAIHMMYMHINIVT